MGGSGIGILRPAAFFTVLTRCSGFLFRTGLAALLPPEPAERNRVSVFGFILHNLVGFGFSVNWFLSGVNLSLGRFPFS